jgi:hypothetical protein
MRVTVLWFVRESMFQDETEHRGEKPKVSNCGRNMHRMRTDGKSIVQLAPVAHLGAVCVIRGRIKIRLLNKIDHLHF